MGCCVFACLGALWPRVTLALIWLFAHPVPEKAFKTYLWPLLGFVFLPTSTLAYELCIWFLGGIDQPLSLAILALAFLHDLGQLGVLRRRKRTVVVQRTTDRDRFVDPGA